MNKKAQSLGPTFVSIPVTFLVLIILIVFLALSIIMSLSKGEIEIVREEDRGVDLVLTSTLMSVLDKPIDTEDKTRDLVVEWFSTSEKQVEDKIEKEVEGELKKLPQKRACYIFRASKGSKQIEVSSFSNSADPRLRSYIESLMKKAAVVYIPFENEKIEVRLTLGDEKC
jgi:hypothetical protein